MRKLLAIAAAAVLLPAAAAQADTKDVSVGHPKGLKGVPFEAFDNDYYPNRVTIAAGDSLRFTWAGFRDIAFVPKGDATPPFAVALPDQPIAGVKDAAGADLWFNGQPTLAPNMGALMPAGGKVIDGSKFVTSGVPMEGPPHPYKVRFPKPGRYTLTSVMQPSIELAVTVRRRGARVPGAEQDRKRLARQRTAASRLAKRLLAAEPGGNVVRAGSDAKSVATIAFFPERRTIDAGESVTFAMSKRSIEIHNIAFGPKDYLAGLAERFLGPVFEPLVIYGSEAPGATPSYDGTGHGNGFLNTGVLDADPTSPLPDRATVTFPKPGTYTYYCVVHGNQMKGEIVVR